MSLSNVLQLAEKFAQQISAQPDATKRTLQRARLWDIASTLSPLLERAEVPPHTTADLKMMISPGPAINFTSVLSPHHDQAAQKLNNLLNQRFGTLMSTALQHAKMDVTDPVNLDWLRITRLGQ
jgi:hypothetical protein